MIDYLKFKNEHYSDELVNKINECIRYLNKIDAPQSSDNSLIICAACGNIIKPGKPAATGHRCILCGSALPLTP